MKKRLGLFVLCAILATLVGGPPENAHAGSSCTSAPPVDLVVESSHAEPKYTDEKMLDEVQVLGDRWGIPRSERRAHPLLIVSTGVEQGVFVIDAAAREVAPGVFCPTPRSVLIRLSFVDRWIVVAHEAAVVPQGSACVAGILREHAEKIIRTEDQLLIDFVNGFSERFGRNLTALKQTSGPNEAETQTQFTSGVRRLAEDAVRQLIASRNSVIAQTINSPEEVQRLRSGCEGMVGRAEASLVGGR
jgi:hypothetical protein